MTEIIKCSRCEQQGAWFYFAYDKKGLPVCDACQCDSWIPDLRAFQVAECYRFDATWGHANATERPATGIDWLDRKSQSVFEYLKACKHKVRT